MSMFYLLCFGAVAGLLQTGCEASRINRASFEARIISFINSNCSGSAVCTIKIADQTEFAWDKMFVFKYTAQRQEVEEALGCPFPGYTEFTRKIVFMNNARIVFSEEEPTNIERLVDHEVVFEIPDSDSSKQYEHEVLFKVSKGTFERGVFYQLTQVR
jgi:hypothetical protein